MLMNHICFAVIVCIIFTNGSSAQVTCYKCTMHNTDPYAPANTPKRPCAAFDGSAVYQVDCPFSTFCMKKTFEIQLGGGRKAIGVHRDCAPQKHSYQAYEIEKGWNEKHEVVESIYSAGCTASSSDLKTSEAQYCYCSSNLCNAATSATASVSLLATLVTLVLARFAVHNL